MRKLFATCIVIIVLMVLGVLAMGGYHYYIRYMLGRMEVDPWKYPVELSDGLVVESPVPLTRTVEESTTPDHVVARIVTHEGKSGSLFFVFENYMLRPGHNMSLDTALELMAHTYEAKGMKLEDISTTEVFMLDRQAVELEATIRVDTVPMRLRVVYFFHGNDFCLVKLAAPWKGLETDELWKRLKSTIRLGHLPVPEKHSPIQRAPANPEKPEWMKRRSDVGR